MLEKDVEPSDKSESSKPPDEEEIGIRNLKLLYRNPPHPERDKSSGVSSDEETTSSSLVPIPDSLRQMRCELKRTISDIGEHSEIESSSFTGRNPAEESGEKTRSSFDELRKIYTLKNEASVAIKMNSANLMLDDILNCSASINVPSNDTGNTRYFKDQETKTKSETETVTTESSSSSVNNCNHVEVIAHAVPPIAFGFPQPNCTPYCASFQPVCTCSSSLEKGISPQDQDVSPRKKGFFERLQNFHLKHKIMCMYKMMQKSPFVKDKNSFEQNDEEENRSNGDDPGDSDGFRTCTCGSKDKYPKRMIFDLVESSETSQSDRLSCKHPHEKLKKTCTCPVELKYGPVDQKQSSSIYPKSTFDSSQQESSYYSRMESTSTSQKECHCLRFPNLNFINRHERNKLNRKKWTVVGRKDSTPVRECTCPKQKEKNKNKKKSQKESQKEVQKEYAKEYSKEYPKEYSKDYPKEHPKEYSKEYLKDYPKEYSKDFSKDYSRDYSKEYSKEFPKEYSKEFPKEYSKEFSKEYSKEFPKEYPKDYAKIYLKEYSKEYPKDFPKEFPKEYQKESTLSSSKECTCSSQKESNPTTNECSCPSHNESSKTIKFCTCSTQYVSSKHSKACQCMNQTESSKSIKECTCIIPKDTSSKSTVRKDKHIECTCPEVLPQCVCHACTCLNFVDEGTSIPRFKKSTELKNLLKTDEYVQVNRSFTNSPQQKEEELKEVSERAVAGSESHSEKKVETETISKTRGGWKKKCTQKRQYIEKTDIYYFDHGNSAYYRTTDRHPTRYTDCLVERTDEYATKFWAEIFGVIAIGLSFVISFIIQFLRFILTSIIRSLTVGLLQIFSDYLFKPLLTIVFNGLVQPCLILVYNMATSVRDLCLPISQIFGFFTKEIAFVLRAFRFVEVNSDSYNKPICNCGNKV